MQPFSKKTLTIILRISVSIVLLIFLFKQVDTKSLLGIIKNADKSLLVLAFFVYLFIYLCSLFRWEMLLKTAEVHLPIKRVIISFAGGLFFNLFLPSTVGGDLVRSIDLSTHTKRPREVVATVLLDRLSGYAGLVLVALLALFFGWRYIQDINILIAVSIITAVLISILSVLFNRFLYFKINRLLHSPRPCAQERGSPTAGRIRQALRDLHHEMHIFRHHKDIIIDNLLLSILIQSMLPLSFYIVALSLGLKINILYFFIYIPVIGAISALPISIGGLGLRDTAVVFFFSKIGVMKDLAFAMSLLNFFLVLLCGILGGLIYVLTIHHRRIQYHKPSTIRSSP